MATGASLLRNNRLVLTLVVAFVLLLGAAGLWLVERPRAEVADRAAIERVVRDYILAHPEIIPEAMEQLRARQSKDAYALHRAAFETPYASAWAGAEKADVTLVMFTDYGCGYCRTSLADIERLIASDPGLKIVWREIPILGPNSEAAARASLAAANQGAYRDFHKQMFAAGVPNPDKAVAVLRRLKIDMGRAQQDLSSAAVTAELQKNIDLIGRIDGAPATPTFVVGGQVLKGAVGYDALRKAVAEARERA